MHLNFYFQNIIHNNHIYIDEKYIIFFLPMELTSLKPYPYASEQNIHYLKCIPLIVREMLNSRYFFPLILYSQNFSTSFSTKKKERERE